MVDTIKMIAFRAETALASFVKNYTKKPKEARALIVQFFKSDADIKVDKQNKLLHIYIHHQPTNRDNISLTALCQTLNETQIEYPGTDMKMVYELLP